jgi:membrane peptidoglycan carboxypeptidase
VLEEYKKNETRVLDQQVSRQVTDILSDNVARTPEFGANSPLNFSEAVVADKTGTTNDFRDVWVLGYTPGIAVGAWAGNNDNSEMQRRIAAFIIAPMWHKIMAYAIQKYPADSFPPPAPDSDIASLPPVLRGEWNTDPTQGVHDILHWVNKNNPRSGRPANPWSDSQYAHWEFPVSIWTGQQPTTPGGGGTTIPGFAITSPVAGAFVSSSQALTLTATHPEPQNVMRISYYVNGTFVGASSIPPYSVSIQPNSFGPAQIKAVADTPLGQQEAAIGVTIQ